MLPRPANLMTLPATCDDADGAASGTGHPAVRALDKRGGLGRWVLEYRRHPLRRGRRGERAMAESVTEHAGHAGFGLRRAEDVAALGLAGDRPDQAGVAGLVLARRGPEPGHQRRAMARHRVQVAEVGEPVDRAEPDAEGAAGGMAIAQCGAGVTETGSGVDGHQLDTRPVAIPGDTQQHGPLAGMLMQVGCRLGHRQREFVAAVCGEPEPGRQREGGAAAGGGGAGILDPQPAQVPGRLGGQGPVHRDHLTTTTLVPAPGSEVSSNSSTRRRVPDSPSPSPVPVVQPSVSASSMSGMPGPSSVK